MAEPPHVKEASPDGVERIQAANATGTEARTTGKDANNNNAAKGEARRRREQRAQRMTAIRERLLEDNQRALIDHPLAHLTKRELEERVAARFKRWGFQQYSLDKELFQRAARVAQNPEEYGSVAELTTEEKRIFRLEQTAGFWDEVHIRVPIGLCCLAAAVQGWTQSSANAANLYYPEFLKMTDGKGSLLSTWLFSAQNAAPFLSGSLAGCWLSDPLNEWFYGRRGAIFVAALFCLFAVVSAAFVTDKYAFLGCRILLGIGMGQKASVVPIYAAEVAPAKLRGRLVINWQVFTALGIAASFSANLIFATMRDKDVAWRLMIGSGIIPTLPLLFLVFACPESPRFLMKRGLYYEAYKSYLRLRGSPIAAAKEMIILDAQLEAAEAKMLESRRKKRTKGDPEQNVQLNDLDFDSDSSVDIPKANVGSQEQAGAVHDVPSEDDDWDVQSEVEYAVEEDQEVSDGPRGFKERVRAWWTRTWRGGDPADGSDPFLEEFRSTNYLSRILGLLTVARCRRASLAAATVMIAQQLCGINILAFYSSVLFRNTGNEKDVKAYISSLKPLWFSWGFGLVNFLFAFPAYPLVDRKGRRWLLLWTFPFMAIFLLATGLSYKIKNQAAGEAVPYMFILMFTAVYSFGGGPIPFAYAAEVYPLTNREVGMSFAVFWNFLGAGLLTLLVPQRFPDPTLLLGVFTGLCMVAWVFIFLFVPETKERTLEEINYIFGVPTLRHASYQLFEVAPYKMDHLVYAHLCPKKTRVVKPHPLYRWYRDVHKEGKRQ